MFNYTSINAKIIKFMASLKAFALILAKIVMLIMIRFIPSPVKKLVKPFVPHPWLFSIYGASPIHFSLFKGLYFYWAKFKQIIWKWVQLPSRTHRPAQEDQGLSCKRGISLRNSQLGLKQGYENERDIAPCLAMPASSNYDLVILPIIDWSFRFQRPQQLARQFAKHGHRVFYVATTFKPEPEPNGNLDGIRYIENNISEIQLPGSPQMSIYRDYADDVKVEEWCDYFNQLRREYNLSEVICLVNLPFWRPLAFNLRELFGWRVVYDCMDKHSGFSTNSPSMLNEEDELAKGSDLVLVTSQKLLEEQQMLNPTCLLAPNACDFEHFCVSLSPVPATIRSLRRPIIGYFGAISDWFDTELVAELAWKRPDWNFVLIGSTFGAQLDPFKGLRNVLLLGEQLYSTIPAYCQAFDVCLIPFKLILLTEATNPVKVYEYLSAGKPVVAVPLPELLPLEQDGLVYLARNAQEFVESIERALHENSAERIENRRKFAQKNTWEERFVCVDRAVRRLYGKASIIVITYNNLHITKLCVDSIFRNTIWPNFELIIVDNASKDSTPGYLMKLAQEHDNIKIILNDRNEGFARANNQGIKEATGEYIVPLNNDTIVTRGWLLRLIRHLESDPKIGMVGPVTNAAGNEAKIDVDYSSVAEMEAFAERLAVQNERKTLEIKMLALFCAAMRRKLLDEIGLLDERFEVGMFEDDDLAFRVKRAGYKLLCCEDVFIHHFHGASFKRLSEEEYMRVFKANRERFETKWGVKWEPHRHRDGLRDR